jgi:hypothetical protein
VRTSGHQRPRRTHGPRRSTAGNTAFAAPSVRCGGSSSGMNEILGMMHLSKSTLALCVDAVARKCEKAASESHACLKLSCTRRKSLLSPTSSAESRGSWMSAKVAALTKTSVPMKVPSVAMPPVHWWMRAVVSLSGPSTAEDGGGLRGVGFPGG